MSDDDEINYTTGSSLKRYCSSCITIDLMNLVFDLSLPPLRSFLEAHSADIDTERQLCWSKQITSALFTLTSREE
jgi:hypothetical protein